MTTFINALLSTLFVRVNDEERGQGLVEYGLIIALIAIVLVVALEGVEGALTTVFGNIVAEL